MPSLLDTVKQNSIALSAATPASNPLLSATGLQPTGGEATQGTAKLMAVGQTGKDVGLSGQTPQMSSLSERLASLQTLNQAKEVTQEAQLQGVSLDQQHDQMQQEFSQASTQLTEQQVGAQEQFNQQFKGMLFEQTNQLKSLDLTKDKSRMEQMGFMLRLGNTQYIDQLQTAGKRARLDNAVSFNENLQRSIFSEEMDLFSNSLEFRNYMYADARDATRQLADMDLDFAMEIANADSKAANSQMMWSGFGNIASAGMSYAAKSPAAPAPDTTSPIGMAGPPSSAAQPGAASFAGPPASAQFYGPPSSAQFSGPPSSAQFGVTGNVEQTSGFGGMNPLIRRST